MATTTKTRRTVSSHRAVAQAHRVQRRAARARRRAAARNQAIGNVVAYGVLITIGVLAVASVATMLLGEEYPAVRQELETHHLPSRLPVQARSALAAVPGALHRLREQLEDLQLQVRRYIGA